MLGLRGCGFTGEVAQVMLKEAAGHRFSVEEVKTDEGFDGKLKASLFQSAEK